MALNLASMFQQAKNGGPVAGTAEQQNIYNAPASNWGPPGDMSDVQQQQNGVPLWAQNILGINAQSMSPDQLNQLNTDYNLTRTRDGRNWNYEIKDSTGKSLGTHQYYDAPFSLMKDFVLPAATIWGGGALLGGALGSAGIGAGVGGAEAGGAALGNGAFLGEGVSSGVGAWDAAAANAGLGGAGAIAGTNIPQFQQLPGYGQQVGGALADASGASPMTGAINSAATNPALIDSALQTPGYGVSSAGIGGGAGTGIAGMLGNAVNGIKSIPGASKVGGSIVSNLLGSVLGGGGVSNLGNLGSLFTNYNQYSQNKDLIDQIKGVYSPDGAYAKTLGEQLGRRDAQAGRNSQYGPRLTELMAKLGDSQVRALSGLMGKDGPLSQQQGGLNGMVGAGSRLFDSMGGMNALAKLFQEPLTNDWALGPNGGPQMPTEDLDNWDLFGG